MLSPVHSGFIIRSPTVVMWVDFVCSSRRIASGMKLNNGKWETLNCQCMNGQLSDQLNEAYMGIDFAAFSIEKNDKQSQTSV
jgi:hypothetical protein